MKLASENGSHLILFKSTFRGLLTAVNRGKTRPPPSSQTTVLLWTLLISQHFNSPRPNAFILCYRTEAESRWKGTRMLSSHLLTARLTASMGRGPQTSNVGEESPRDQAERGRGGREVEVGCEWHIDGTRVPSLLGSQPKPLGSSDHKGPEPMPAPATMTFSFPLLFWFSFALLFHLCFYFF